MEILTKEQLWRYMLKKEPTREQRKRRYLWEGFIYWMAMCRRYPKQAAKEIGAMLLILGLGFGVLWINEIDAWIVRILK